MDSGLPGTIEVSAANADGRPAAIIRLCGEHDIATASEMKAAVDSFSADAPLIIDATECSFMDSSILGAMVTCRRGRPAFALVVPDDVSAAVTRAVEVTSLGHVLNACRSLPAAIEHIERQLTAPT